MLKKRRTKPGKIAERIFFLSIYSIPVVKFITVTVYEEKYINTERWQKTDMLHCSENRETFTVHIAVVEKSSTNAAGDVREENRIFYLVSSHLRVYAINTDFTNNNNTEMLMLNCYPYVRQQ